MDFDFQHLAPLEPASRIFCDMQGQDPDEQLEVPHPMGLQGVKFTRPAWHFAAENLLNLTQMLAALQRASKAAPAQRDLRQGELFPTEH